MEYIMMGVFIVLEFLFRKRPFNLIKRGFWIDVVWYTFLQNIILQYAAFQFIELFFSNYHWHLVSGLPILIQLLITILIIEFIAYWIHRINHSWWVMWRVHEVHHSSIELNWLSANRFHFVELTIIRVISGAIIAFLGASTATLFLFVLFDSFMACFVHANLDVKIGPLKYFFNCPEMHQIHHANKMDYQNCNFGDKISFWDWIFGTAKLLPKDQFDAIEFGIGYEYPQDLLGQLTHMFRKNEEEKLPE